MTSIIWFRQDLRLDDNPALSAAASAGLVLPVYILDERPLPNGRPLGSASRWWLHHSLAALAKSLGGLVLAKGDPQQIMADLVKRSGAGAVYWNRCYEPQAVARDRAMKSMLQASVDVRSFNGSLLQEPWDVMTGAGGPFQVFTPYWRAHQKREGERPPSPRIPSPAINLADLGGLGVSLDELRLLPTGKNWAQGWHEHWTPGEQGAFARLDQFVDDGLNGYADGRDRPDHNHGSRLSPHLHFGDISPRTVRARVTVAAMSGDANRKDVEKFMSEIGWREFAHHCLYHFPEMPEKNWRSAFDAYPWREDPAGLAAWQRGLTGYPMVDAGMRELWATGTMHNRVRMIAASFLVKHLQIDWRRGQDWFWDTLVDADLANNAAGWQWVAGSGFDASPYFRVFNPVRQGRAFDPKGTYVRRWCPELSRLPDAYVHAPFEATAGELTAAGVTLGGTYPNPIVDHARARTAALAGYATVKRTGPA